MKKITVDAKYTKTYKTVKNLEKALDKMNLDSNLRWIETWTAEGRVTAVFINASGFHIAGSLASNGFKVVG